jgi:hypothetical protein
VDIPQSRSKECKRRKRAPMVGKETGKTDDQSTNSADTDQDEVMPVTSQNELPSMKKKNDKFPSEQAPDIDKRTTTTIRRNVTNILGEKGRSTVAWRALGWPFPLHRALR